MINTTEIIDSHYSRSCSFKDAIQNEIDDFEKRKTWEIITKSSIPWKVKMLGGILVTSIKNEGTPQEILKARFVVQVYRDPVQKLFGSLHFPAKATVP